MSKMSELDAVVTELRKCGETLVDISNTLGDIFGETVDDMSEASQPQQPAEQESTQQPTQPEPEVPTVTLEQLRGVLAEKSANGHREQVQSLIHEFGAEKLSAVDPANYAAMLARAEVM